MNDLSEVTQDIRAAEFPAADPCTSALARARQALGWSREEAAAHLKISSRKIAALEEERWEELPGPPFSIGLLRSYAKLLKLDANALIAEMVPRMGAESGIPDLKSMPQLRAPFRSSGNVVSESGMGKFMVMAAVAFALAALFIAWSGTDSFRHVARVAGIASKPVLTSSALPTPAAVATEPDKIVVSPDAGSATTASTNTVNTANAVPALNESTATPFPASADAAPVALLALRFVEDSWVEVRQADGKILLSQVSHAGTEQALNGIPPLTVVIGNAAGVELQMRGAAVDLAPYTHDKTARLTLR